MTRDLRPVSGTTRLLGVIGDPVDHSRSPALHNGWLARHGIDAVYLALPVARGDFAEVARALPKMGFLGANVTVPHKEDALAAAAEATPAARAIGAANTLSVAGDRLVAHNTDADGFVKSLDEEIPGWRDPYRPAVVLGAGGAAAAVVHALVEAGYVRIRIANRSSGRAEALAARFAGIGRGIDTVPWARRTEALAGAGLLVNTTSLGMTGQPPLEIDVAALPDGASVADIVYAPEETPLVAAARARGLAATGGLGMLRGQARKAFEIWFGIDPEGDRERDRAGREEGTCS